MRPYFDEDQAWKEIEQANKAGHEFEFIGPVLERLREKAVKAALSDEVYAATPHMRDRHIATVNALDAIKAEFERITKRGESARNILEHNQRNS